jgi:hypothetical protein
LAVDGARLRPDFPAKAGARPGLKDTVFDEENSLLKTVNGSSAGVVATVPFIE